jgi:uncharacterized protein
MRYLFLLLFLLQQSVQEESFLIDIHTHIGTFRGYEIGERILLDCMDEGKIQFALVSNIDGANVRATKNLNEFDANAATEHFVRSHLDRFRGLLWARPKDGFPSQLERFLSAQDSIFVGIKFHPEFNQFAADDPRVHPYLKLCEKYGVPAIFHSGSPGAYSDPERIYSMARKHPSVPVILYHMGFFGPHERAIQVAARSRKNRDAKIYLETSQVDVSSVLLAVKQLGSSAVLFGTDATYYGRNHYSRYQNLLNSLRQNLTREEYFDVTAGNAIRIFRLPGDALHFENVEMSESLPAPLDFLF